MLSNLGALYYGKKWNNSIVHSDGATYSKLDVPIVHNINILISE